MKTIAVIPARLASTRLPRKMLREIAGKPLVGWVYEAVRSSPLLSDVIIATDSEEILEACHRHDWKAQMTSSAHRSGTERVHEISNSIAADVYVNVQGDEPLVRTEQIGALLDVMQRSNVQVGTVKTPCPDAEVGNPNALFIFPVPPSRSIAIRRAHVISNIWASMHIAGRRWIFLSAGRNRFSKGASAWSNSASWKTGLIFLWAKLFSIPWAWIRNRTYSGSRKS